MIQMGTPTMSNVSPRSYVTESIGHRRDGLANVYQFELLILQTEVCGCSSASGQAERELDIQ